MAASILPAVTALLARTYLHIPAEALPADQPLISTGLIDSFSLVDLALLVESEFGVRLDDSELNAETFDTPAELARLIQERKARTENRE